MSGVVTVEVVAGGVLARLADSECRVVVGRQIAKWDAEGRDIGLRHNMCRRPIGKSPKDMRTQRFCSMPTAKGESYCPHCKPRLVIPPKSKAK